jgi:hypothetical protein
VSPGRLRSTINHGDWLAELVSWLAGGWRAGCQPG